MHRCRRGPWFFAASLAFGLSFVTAGAGGQDSSTSTGAANRGDDSGPKGSWAARRAWLGARIDRILAARPSLSGARFGLAIRDLTSGAVLYERDADGPYSVASNAKLATSMAALALLGPDYRYATVVYGEEILPRGALTGDLYVKGRGDPTLDTERLRQLALELWLAGIRRVRGDLVIDDSYFDGATLPPHFDEQPEEHASFRAPVGAVSLNANAVNLIIAASLGGRGPAAVVIDPPSDYIQVHGQVRTVRRGRTRLHIRQVERPSHIEFHLSGKIFAGQIRRIRRRVGDPALYFGHTFRRLLQGQGIAVGRRVRLGRVPDELESLAVIHSPPLSDLVRALGKYSNNYVAEVILKTIGAERAARDRGHPTPATWEDGLRAVRQFLTEEVGLKAGSFRYDNGSGLFDATRFSPRQIVTILQAAHRDFRYGPDLLASLAIGGVDGTLRGRMDGGPALRRVRAKTGTLERVACLAGYVGARGDAAAVFTILVNDLPPDAGAIDEARSVQDEIVEALATFVQAWQ